MGPVCNLPRMRPQVFPTKPMKTHTLHPESLQFVLYIMLKQTNLLLFSQKAKTVTKGPPGEIPGKADFISQKWIYTEADPYIVWTCNRNDSILISYNAPTLSSIFCLWYFLKLIHWPLSQESQPHCILSPWRKRKIYSNDFVVKNFLFD